MPVASVPIALPWSTGAPASFYWRVRATNGRAVSGWSRPNRFTMGWDKKSLDIGVPDQRLTEPGFVRWSKVAGAVGYQVWFTNLAKPRTVSTITNVADLREYYADHAPGSPVRWRVRSLRRVYGVAQNGLPALLYGTWSPEYRSELPASPPPALHPVPRYAQSDETLSWGTYADAHELVPAFIFSTGDGHALHRVYVATDDNCINVVHISPAVSGNAYAPRSTGGDAQTVSMIDWTPAVASESVPARPVGGAAASGASLIPVDFLQKRAAVDSGQRLVHRTVLLDGRPVGTDGHDQELPQFACQDGRRGEFKKTSVKPDLADGVVPFATGLSPSGGLHSARTSSAQFYGGSLVTWRPAPAAAAYDVEWSRKRSPWKAASGLTDVLHVRGAAPEARHVVVSRAGHQRLVAG